MGRFLNLIARFRRRRKTALVLSSGAARGLAHIGVIKALKEENIRIDLIVGSSIGALVGACYAKDSDISEFEKVVLKTDWKRMLGLADFNLAIMSKGLIHGEKVTKLMKGIFGDITFSDLKIPLVVVATDADTGEEVIIQDGSVVEAVRASISMPAIFVPIRLRNRFLVDGGIVNPVPIDIARQAGAGFIIASDALPHPKDVNLAKKRRNPKAKEQRTILNGHLPDKQATPFILSNLINKFIGWAKNKGRVSQKQIDELPKNAAGDLGDMHTDTPAIFDVFAQAFFTMEYEIAKSKLEKADVLIRPDVAHISSLEFYRGQDAIREGYAAAKKSLSTLKPGFKIKFRK